MFVAQQSLAAPGCRLREQLIYPSTKQVPLEQLWALLRDVELEHLLDRVGGDFEQANDWQGSLPGCLPLNEGCLPLNEGCLSCTTL